MWWKKRILARRYGGCNANGLHQAVRQCNFRGVRELVAFGISIESRDIAGRTPLFHAVRLGELALVRELLKLGASADAADDHGNTPLMEAIISGDKHILEELLLTKPQLNRRNREGDTPLILAVREGNTTFTRMLLREGAEPNLANQKGQTPIMLAVMDSKTAIVTSLLEAGADPEQQDLSGKSALDLPVASPRIRKLLKVQSPKESSDKSSIETGALGDMVGQVIQTANQWLSTSTGQAAEERGKELLTALRQVLGVSNQEDAGELLQSGAGLLVLLMQEAQRGMKQISLNDESRARLWSTIDVLVSRLASGLQKQEKEAGGLPEQHIHFHLPPLTKDQEKDLNHALKEAISVGADRAADLLTRLGAVRSNGNGHHSNGKTSTTRPPSPEPSTSDSADSSDSGPSAG